MDHPRCKTCKHFGTLIRYEDNPLGLRECLLVAEHWEMFEDEDTDDNRLKPEFAGHLASVSDLGCHHAMLNVHEDFYCAMHSDLMPELTPYAETE